MSKLKMWDAHSSFEEAERDWDKGASKASLDRPIKSLSQLPNMPAMAGDTSKNLKWKAFKWMIVKDENWELLKKFMRHPVKYGTRLVKSILNNKPYIREGDFFLYGIKSLNEFEALIQDKNALLVAGFSYCHKPFECPSGRFTDACIHDPLNSVCRQCFIGKCVNALPEQNSIPLFIPTIHYIGGKILDIVHSNPKKKIIFLITACEMTLEMFGDLGNMVDIKGVGVRLDGRICNTMKAFHLSEMGIKPGLTVVLDETQKKMIELIKKRRES